MRSLLLLLSALNCNICFKNSIELSKTLVKTLANELKYFGFIGKQVLKEHIFLGTFKEECLAQKDLSSPSQEAQDNAEIYRQIQDVAKRYAGGEGLLLKLDYIGFDILEKLSRLDTEGTYWKNFVFPVLVLPKFVASPLQKLQPGYFHLEAYRYFRGKDLLRYMYCNPRTDLHIVRFEFSHISRWFRK